MSLRTGNLPARSLVLPGLVYRSELAALEMRHAKLLGELSDLSVSARELAEQKAICEAELASVSAALRAAARPRHVQVANPCTVSWDAMKGDERARFCGVCAKSVYNLSAMSTAEVEALLRRQEGLCVRFYTRPDGTVLTTECRRAGPRRRARAVAGVVAVAALMGTSATFLFASGEDIRVVSVGELCRHGGEHLGRPVRVEGTLVHGSLTKWEAPCEFRFRLSGDGCEVPVRHAACMVPDNFRDIPGRDLPVLVDGEVLADGSFAATSAIANVAQGYRMKSAEGPPEPSAR